MRSKTLLIGVIGIVIGVLLSTAVVFAGDLNPGSGPGAAGSQMYTLQQVWNRINNGAAATKMSAFTEPSAGPGSTMKTLDDLYTLAGERSRPPKTGDTFTDESVTGEDGELQKGVVWPSPRLTDNGNGTVTDNLTGLIWLKNANCFGMRDWATALSDANALASGSCSLSDGSVAGDWRLPNLRELQSLIDYGRYGSALPSGHPFTGVQSVEHYWTRTTTAGRTSTAWSVRPYDGYLFSDAKPYSTFVWPVRGGQ